MYQFLYSEILEDGPEDARHREREAFDQALVQLLRAEEKGPRSTEGVRALYFLQQLWTVLIDDLCSPENDLPQQLKAGLLSVGIWVGKEIDAMREGTVKTFAGLIEINQIVRDGLK